MGLEVNPRAAKIADVVLWIGYLQWHFRTHGEADYKNKLSYQPKLTSSPHFHANRLSSFSFPLLFMWVSK